MIILYLILLILLLLVFPCKLKLRTIDTAIYNDYLSKENTLAIKGFFVTCVLFSHSKDYIDLSSDFLDNSFNFVSNFLGQLIVVMFLFYSGYGIFESFKTKGQTYIDKFISKRFFPTWVNFAICMVLFVIFNLIFRREYSLTDVLLSFTGWTSIGNSNWFMFVTFALYILFFISFQFTKKLKPIYRLIVFTLATTLLISGLFFVKESWWWNTISCFVLGMWYSFFKDKIDVFVGKNNYNYVICICIAFAVFVLTFLLKREWEIGYCFYAMSFAIIVVIATMKIKFNSIVCSFLGKHVFSIYILQRMVFISISFTNLNDYKFIFVIVAYSIIICIAVLYDYCYKKISQWLMQQNFRKYIQKNS